MRSLCYSVTHLLLSTLVAGSLDTRLSLFVTVGMIIIVVMINEAARTTLKPSQAGAPLALDCAAMSRADWASRAHRRCPSGNHHGPAVHATPWIAAMGSDSSGSCSSNSSRAGLIDGDQSVGK